MIVQPFQYKQQNLMGRTSQRTILPSGIKNRNLNQNTIVTTSLTAFAPVTFGNGTILHQTSTVTQVNERPIVIEKYWESYIGTVTTANNIFSAGGSVSTAGLLIRGPVFDSLAWDGTKWVSVHSLHIENVSAGSITVTTYVREKIIVLSDSTDTTTTA